MARNKDWNQILSENNDNFTTLIDSPDSNTTYIGKARFGTLTSEAKWQIKKIVVDGSVTSILYANGDDAFQEVWEDRASLTYS